MVYTYIYEPRALREYEEAILWYHERSVEVSHNFELAIDEKMDEICMHPKRYRNMKKSFHEAMLKKFPYSIVYFIDEECKTIVVVSVFHSSRNPEKKYM